MDFDKIELGTPETAVKSCVNLLSRLFEQPEEYVACYLDLYYQVRRRWEEDTDSGRSRTPAPTDMVEAPAGRAQGAEDGGPPRAEGESAQRAERSWPGPSAPTGAAETPAELVEEPVNGPKRAAQEKRRIRDRFFAAREKGLSLPELIRASDGNVTKGDLWKVINAHNLGIQHYRDIDAALDRLSL